MTYIGDTVPDRDEMAAWQYQEQNPGYEREIGLTASDLTDDGEPMDPEFARHYAEHVAAENARIREGNRRTTELRLRAENEELRNLLRTHGITPPPEEN